MNQCDGCLAGKPLIIRALGGAPMHRMGADKYPDYMICQKERYS